MRINPINNITKKALPLVAAATIGLGSMTACTSPKENKSDLSYTQTEMLKLDNTLDSLKTVRGEGDIAFFDYYEKSKTTIKNAQLDDDKSRDSKTSKGLMWSGVALAALGLINALGAAVYNSPAKKLNRGLAAACAGCLAIIAGVGGQDFKSWQNKTDFNHHKEQKLKQLEIEKLEYVNTPEVTLND